MPAMDPCDAVEELQPGDGVVQLDPNGALAWFEVVAVERGAVTRVHVEHRPEWGSPEGDP